MRALSEPGHDLLGEAVDHILVLRQARQVDDHVVGPGGGDLFDSCREFVGGEDLETLAVLLQAILPAGPGVYLRRVFAGAQQVDILQAGADGDLRGIAAQRLAVTAQHLDLLFDRLGVAGAKVAAVRPLRDQFQRYFLATTAQPERGVRTARALRYVDRP